MTEKETMIVIQPKQGVIYVTEDHSRIYSNFHVDTFRSNYNFTEDAIKKILDIFKQYYRFARKGCYYSASQTYICSPRLPSKVFKEMFTLALKIVNDKDSYFLINGGGRA